MIGFLLIGCGVDTSSSADNTEIPTDSDDDNSSTDDDNNNSDDQNSSVVVDGDSSSAGFSTTDAEEDANACNLTDTYKVITDSSFDPSSAADATNGVAILSQYAYTTDVEATKVALYYPSLTATKVDTQLYVYEDNYQLNYDKAWQTNVDANVYVRTPQNEYGIYSCYRYALDSLSDGSITKTKVYR